MSGQITTPAAAPVAGCTKYASQTPSGVLILTSDSVTAAALAARGSTNAMPAPSDNAPNWRRVTAPRAVYSFRSSSK